MHRAVATIATVLVGAWVVAHLFYLGPVQAATEVAMSWATGLAIACVLVAAITVLVWALVLGRDSPTWLRFVQQARTAAALVGGALVIVGLVHWRDTEPRSEIHWLVIGVAILVGAMAVHGWLVLTRE